MTLHQHYTAALFFLNHLWINVISSIWEMNKSGDFNTLKTCIIWSLSFPPVLLYTEEEGRHVWLCCNGARVWSSVKSLQSNSFYVFGRRVVTGSLWFKSSLISESSTNPHNHPATARIHSVLNITQYNINKQTLFIYFLLNKTLIELNKLRF